MSQKRPTGSKLKSNSYVARKRKMKFIRKSVLKMLAVMEASQSSKSSMPPDGPTPTSPDAEDSRPQDFLQSGRTGRRNALANILSEHACVTSSDLPSQLEALTTKDKSENSSNNEANTSKS